MNKMIDKLKDFIVAVIVSVKQELESSDKAKKCCDYKIEATQATKGAVKKSAKINSSNKCAKTSTKSSKKSKKERDINALLDSIAKDRAKQGKRI